MKSTLTRIVFAALCLALGGCASLSSIFDGPPVPYGTVTLGGKTVTVKQLGVDCVCPLIPALDSPVPGAVYRPRAGCNTGDAICTPPSIYVYEHEALELTTGLRHSNTLNAFTGCYDIQVGGGDYRKGDQLCAGHFGDYRVPGRESVALAKKDESLTLRLSSACECQARVVTARRQTARAG
jgi:hypothetical protein